MEPIILKPWLPWIEKEKQEGSLLKWKK